MKFLFFILIIIGFSIPAHAQFYVGDDFGALSYDISDQFIGSYRYEKIIASFLNPTIFYLNENHFFFARFGKKITEADIVVDGDYQASNMLEIVNYELDIEYFRKVLSISNELSGFVGIAQNGHFSYHNRVFRSSFYSNETESHEMGGISLSVNSLLKYEKQQTIVQYKVGVGMFAIGSRPRVNNTNIELRRYTFNEYFRIHQSVQAFIKVSDRFLLKPEYQFRYYTFKDPERFKMLKQSFLIGLYIRL